MSDGYNGWSNYETWNVKLWMDNDEGSYHYWQDRTAAIADASDEDDSAIYELAQEIQSWHEEMRPETNGVFADLLGAALSEVDWSEIAHSLMCDYRADNPREVEEASNTT